MQIDFWYGNTMEQVTHVTCSFSDIDCTYRGNLYIGNKAVGDFICSDSTIIEQWFPGIFE